MRRQIRFFWSIEGFELIARIRHAYNAGKTPDVFREMSRADMFQGLTGFPAVPSTMTMFDITPRDGLMHFPEGMREMLDDPLGNPAPAPGSVGDPYPNKRSVGMRIQLRGSPNHAAGEAGRCASAQVPPARVSQPRGSKGGCRGKVRTRPSCRESPSGLNPPGCMAEGGICVQTLRSG